MLHLTYFYRFYFAILAPGKPQANILQEEKISTFVSVAKTSSKG